MIRLLLAIPLGCLVTMPQPASASIATGLVGSVRVTPSGLVRFNIVGSRSTPPACSTSPDWQFAVSVTTTGTSALYAGLLTAQANQYTVTVYGDDACSTQPTIEDVQSIRHTPG